MGCKTKTGLTILRVGLGASMLINHGYPKLMSYGMYAAQFPDPLGIGSTYSMALATFAEFFCSILLILGLGTRFAAINLAFTMAVAFFLFHAADPFVKKELAFLYLIGFLALIVSGSGKYALNNKLVPKGLSGIKGWILESKKEG